MSNQISPNLNAYVAFVIVFVHVLAPAASTRLRSSAACSFFTLKESFTGRVPGGCAAVLNTMPDLLCPLQGSEARQHPAGL